MNFNIILTIYKMPMIAIMVIISMGIDNAQAQVYKCQSGKETVYSDKPCATNTQQTITEIDNYQDNDGSMLIDSSENSAGQTKNINALNRQLDAAVKSAIENGDLARATALASTNQQRGWVNQAQKQAKNESQGRTEADLMAEKTASSDCKLAIQVLQSAADDFSDLNEIGVKTSLMYVACGIKEPTPIIYSNPIPRFYRYPYNQNLPSYGGHLREYQPKQNNSGHYEDHPKTKL